MEAQGQQPAVESIVHKLAKPATKLLAWSACGIAASALALATWRNVREG